MREIKKQLCIRQEEFVFILASGAIAFLFGEILLAVVVNILHEKDSIFPIGTFLTLLIMLVMFTFLGITSMATNYCLGIRMCSTRRRFVPMLVLGTFVEFLAALAEVYLLYHLEIRIFRLAYAGIENEVDLGILFQWKYILCAGVMIIALNLFFGALYLKFGQLVFIIFWLFWIAFSISIQGISHILSSDHNSAWAQFWHRIADLCATLSENGMIAILISISIMFSLISWFMLRKQEARS